ncbi:MAG: hypothetical protein GQ477_03575 [Nanohaloarchaea archaeon]|nr:hypothetical protein [Candidatus Nanohaloarchaea archaeon]
MALINISETETDAFIRETITFFKEKDRIPAVCITPFTRPKNLPSKLKAAGFKIESKEAWMFYKGQNEMFEIPENIRIIPVQNKDEMDTYIDIFKKRMVVHLMTRSMAIYRLNTAILDPHGSLTGAKWKSELHMDAIILKPTVYIDNKKIMDCGKYIISDEKHPVKD